LLADAFFPLLLMWVLRLRNEPRRAVVPLSLTLAAIWLSNAPAAVIAMYSVVLLALVICVLDRKWRAGFYAVVAIAIALGLAAFYIIPAAWEQKWVNIGEILSPGVRPGDNFLFTTIADPEHNVFNFLVSLVAVAEIVVVALGIVALQRWRRERPNLWWPLFIWAAITTVLMFSVTNIFWEHLPKLKFVQLPWRWLVALNVVFAIVLAAAVRRNFLRLVLMVVIAVGMFAVSARVLPPWWDTAQDVEGIHQSIVSGAGYEGTDEYVPRGADPYEVKQDAPKVEALAEGAGEKPVVTVSDVTWRAELRTFSVQASEPAKLVLRLFNSPAWRAEVSGRAVPTKTMDVTGQMVIAVPAGHSRVTIRFMRTRDRTIGIAVSVITALLLIIIGVRWRRVRANA
jgi:hypothetical protein